MPSDQIQLLPSDGEPNTVSTIRARGEISLRAQVIWIVGIALACMFATAALILFKKPDYFDTYLTHVLPVISGAIFGLTGFAVGQQSKDR